MTRDEAWAELGIAPTGDQAAVRRAYARRLKEIDADRDPAAFMRLREAYVGALADAEGIAAGNVDKDGDDEDFAGVATPARPVDAPDDGKGRASGRAPSVEPFPALPHDAVARFRSSFRSAIGDGDTRSAVGLLQSALAAGVVPLGQERALMGELAQCAMADATLSPEEIEALGRTFDMASLRIGDRTAQALHDFVTRPEAQRWQEGILRDARRGDRWIIGRVERLFMKRVRIARAIRGPGHHNLMISRDLPAFRREVVNARRYARLLSEPFDPQPLEAKLQRLEATLAGHEVLAVLVGLILIPLLGFTDGWSVAAVLWGLFVACVTWLFLAR